MKLKLKREHYLLLAIVGIALLLAAPSLSIGATPISCTKPQFNSADPFYDEAFQCTMAATGSGKYLETYLSPSDAQNLFGVMTEQPAKIEVEVLKDECSYRFDNKSYPIYKYQITDRAVTQSNGKYVCQCSIENPACGSYQVTSVKGEYLGTTPIQCKSDCLAYKPGEFLGGCTNVYKKQIGSIYYLVPNPDYDFEMEVRMTLGDKTYTTTINKLNTTGFTQAFRTELLGQFQGQTSCPANPDVAIFVTSSSTPVKYISKFSAENVIREGLSIINRDSAAQYGTTYNTYVSQMQSSTPNVGQYASFSTTEADSVYTAEVSIDPEGTVSIPVFNLYINAEEIGIHVPVGQPEILNVSAIQAKAANKAYVNVQTKNNGETDSFVFSVQCSKDASPFSVRETLNAGETKTVQIPYEGAGFIEQCTVSVKSVGSENQDSETVRLSIEPFCTRPAPSPYHEKIMTEYGCAYICPKYYYGEDGYDVFDTSCGKMEDYDRCTEYDENACIKHNNTKSITNESGTYIVGGECLEYGSGCLDKNSYTGIHCTGVGTYLETDDYMDSVNEGDVSQFLPSKADHKYFLTTLDNKAVCRYVDEYGYADGVSLTSLEFDYARGVEGAEKGTTDLQPYAGTESPSLPPNGELDATQIFLIVGVVVIVSGVAYFTMLKKKKGRKK